jgi:hypothetical protein
MNCRGCGVELDPTQEQVDVAVDESLETSLYPRRSRKRSSTGNLAFRTDCGPLKGPAGDRKVKSNPWVAQAIPVRSFGVSVKSTLRWLSRAAGSAGGYLLKEKSCHC